jgi:hypothetical protein
MVSEVAGEDRAALDDAAIRAVVSRLARRHASGGKVIERAAILAEGTDSSAILAWLDAHDWVAEESPTATREHGGLHAARQEHRDRQGVRSPRRYILGPGLTL